MRASGFQATHAPPNSHKAPQPRDAAGAVQSTSPEPVDEEIESLLASLGELPVEPGPARPDTAARTSRRPREYRSLPRQRRQLPRVDQVDLLLLMAVVLGLAVGLATVFLLDG